MIKDGHISPFQLIALFSILLFGKQLDPSVLLFIHWGHNAPELFFLIAQVSMIALISLMLPLFKDPNKNLFDHFHDLFGPIFGSMLTLLIFIMVLLVVSTSVVFDLEQIRTVFLPTTPATLTLFILITSMVIPSYFGIEVMGRSNLLVFFVISTVLIIWNLLMWPMANVNNIPPIFGPGIPQLLKQGILHSGFFIELIVYLMMRPYVRSYTSYKRSFYLVAMITLVIGMFRLLLVQLIMPYPVDDQVFFPFIEIVKLIYAGKFFEHLEAVYTVGWLVLALARLSFMVYVLVISAATLARAHNHRRFIPSIGALIYYIALLNTSLSDAIDFTDVVLVQRFSLIYGFIFSLFIAVSYAKLLKKKWAQKKQIKPQPT